MALVASVPGSPYQPVLAPGAGPSGPFRALAGAVGLDALRGNVLVAAGVVAILLAAGGFLLLLRESWRGNISLRTIVLLAVVYHAVVLLLPLLFSRDVYSYAIQGRIAAVHGANPYVTTPAAFPGDPLYSLVGPKWLDTPSVYGPGFTLLAAGLAREIDDVPGLVVAFRVLAAAASLVTLALVVGVVRRERPERAAFAAALFGLNPVVLFQSVGSGHNDLLVALAVAGAFALVARGRTVAAAAALMLGALVKATAVLPLVLLVVWAVARAPVRERRRTLALHAGTVAAIGLAVAAPFLQTKDPTLGMLELAKHEGWLAPSRFVGRALGGLAGWLGGNGAETIVAGLVRIGFAATLVGVLALIARGVARRPYDPPVTAWGWSLVLLMLLGPVLLPWYVTWALPVAWLLPRVPRLCLVVTGVALSVSQFTAELSRFPAAYDANVLFGHYVLAPLLFGLLLWAVRDLRRRLRHGDLATEDAHNVAARAGGG